MSDQARNFRVGVFVLAGMLAVGTCAVMLGGQDLFAPKIRFESYFDEPVTGLEVGSPVKFRGVKIGVVKSIGLVEDYYDFPSEEDRLRYGQRVSILMERVIEREEDEDLRDLSYEEYRQRLERMIERGLRLRITQLGITGTAFIQADYMDPKAHPPMKITWQPRHIYIPSAPSTIAALTSAAERFAAKMETVDIQALGEQLEALVTNLASATGDLDTKSLQTEALALLTDLRETNRMLRSELERADMGAVGDRVRATLDEAEATLVRTRRLVDGSAYDLEQALENARVATENLRDLTETLKAQPSLVIGGKPPEPVLKQVGP